MFKKQRGYVVEKEKMRNEIYVFNAQYFQSSSAVSTVLFWTFNLGKQYEQNTMKIHSKYN